MNRLVKCERCEEPKLKKYNVCPRCGYHKYSDKEWKHLLKLTQSMKKWRIKHPLIQHNVR